MLKVRVNSVPKGQEINFREGDEIIILPDGSWKVSGTGDMPHAAPFLTQPEADAIVDKAFADAKLTFYPPESALAPVPPGHPAPILETKRRMAKLLEEP